MGSITPNYYGKRPLSNSNNHTNRQTLNQTTEPKWLYHKADWMQYQQKLQDVTLAEIHNPNINTYYNNLVDCINKAALASIPRTSNIPTKYKVPWWNTDCKTAI
jgi:hypothetical protein